MVDRSWARQEITTFKGSWSLVEKTDIQFDGSLLARNCRYLPGSVLSRLGIRSVLSPNDAITSLWNWIFADASLGSKNFLVYFKSGYGVRIIDLAIGTPSNLFASVGYGAVFANAGSRFISAQYTTLGLGAESGKIYGFAVGSDDLFARPVLESEVTIGSTPSAGGTMTPGSRNLAFIVTTRNGFRGRPSPGAAADLTLVPTTVTTTTVNAKTQITLTPTGTWPSFTGDAQLIMTTTGNLSRYYFVPAAVASIPGGSALPVSISLDVSDERLVLGDDATPYLSLLTQDSAGVAPFRPCGLIEAGSRIGYVFKNSEYGQGVFFSDPNNYQAIAALRNEYYLSGQKEVVTGCYLQGTIYLIGPNWTYAVSDNGDYPATWASPQLVDGNIGTVCPQGVNVSARRSMAWVVAKEGLFILRPSGYDTLPVSYFNQGDWNKINWALFYAIQVVDNPSTNRVSVIAPLVLSGTVNVSGTAVTYVSGDEFAMAWTAGTTIIINGVSRTISTVNSPTSITISASGGTLTGVTYSVTPTYNTHKLTWDYTDGDSATSVKFSLDNFANLNPASIATVQDPVDKRIKLWMGQSVVGDIWSECVTTDPLPYRDGSSPIDATYQTSLFPSTPGRSVEIIRHQGAHFRVLGSGQLGITAYSIDNAQNAILLPVTLSTSPGQEYFRGLRMISECKSYRLSNGRVLDAWFQLSRILDYTTVYAQQR